MFPLFDNLGCYQSHWEYLSMKLAFLYSVVLTTVIVRSHGLNCSIDAPCVRFCCTNCTDFDIAEIDGADKLNVNVQALKGRPCGDMYALDPTTSSDDEWSLAEVSM